MEKANDYAVDSLKQIMTLSSAVLALTITFIKDVLGDARSQAIWIWLVPSGWLWLIMSILFAWFGIVAAADQAGGSSTAIYVFQADKRPNNPPLWPYNLY